MPNLRAIASVVTASVIILWPLLSSASIETELTPYSLTYETIEGPKATLTRTLSREGKHWRLLSKTSGRKFLKFTFTQDSLFELIEGQPSTISASSKLSSIVKRKQSFSVNENNKLQWHYKDETGTLDAQSPVIDQSTSQLYIEDFARRGQQAFSINLFNKRGFTEQKFKLDGSAEVATEAGTFDTIKVARVRENSKRSTIMYLAPDLNYAMVRIDQLDDGEAIVMVLKSGAINGKSIADLIIEDQGDLEDGN